MEVLKMSEYRTVAHDAHKNIGLRFKGLRLTPKAARTGSPLGSTFRPTDFKAGDKVRVFFTLDGAMVIGKGRWEVWEVRNA
jgi:hypothetical protein